ncbi:cysteine-rich small domain-containing protein [Methanogenium cariaci]|uniref:cysteine-rich small domain-containing protein n=1 Tax=Methanogenium cariaci TaxID=2197 RepID=UPI000784B509|nr:cysteine-rich small domain-containing protein [Methanogenium cariaci]
MASPETWTATETPFHRKPAFYIHSSIGGDRWSQWNPDGCPPYYPPCHPSCEGQRCDFCYCPLYPPCGEESLGKWLERENGGNIWSCEDCTLVHEPAVADYLTLHPEASVEELIDIRKKGKNQE